MHNRTTSDTNKTDVQTEPSKSKTVETEFRRRLGLLLDLLQHRMELHVAVDVFLGAWFGRRDTGGEVRGDFEIEFGTLTTEGVAGTG